jgi:mannose-6-phosphate isomerase-like protein (cupin superfamily)
MQLTYTLGTKELTTMADYTSKQIDEMEGAFGGGLKKARAELGVESFGMQVVDLPPNYTDYPEHDHASDGQEEVYSVMRGSGEIDVEGERIPLTEDVLVRVGPAAKRKIFSGPEGLRLLALGGTPGAAYEAAEFTELTSA